MTAYFLYTQCNILRFPGKILVPHFGVDLPQIDLLIGGSPCQGFSFAGKQLNFDDPRSKLFYYICDWL